MFSVFACVCASVLSHFTSLKVASVFANRCCTALQQVPNAQWHVRVKKSIFTEKKASEFIFGGYLLSCAKIPQIFDE